MHISELIAELQKMLDAHGDRTVCFHGNYGDYSYDAPRIRIETADNCLGVSDVIIELDLGD